MANSDDDQLREMAEHRGLKLVRSRRRKPGVGDFGKFGLTKKDGTALLGIGAGELTASAEEIENYLRSTELGSWKQSAETTPDLPKPAAKETASRPQPDEQAQTVRRRSKQQRRQASSVSVEAHSSSPARQNRATAKPTLKVVPDDAPAASEPKPKFEPKPVLRIRPAHAADAPAISKLLSQLKSTKLDAQEVAANMAAAGKLKAGMVVAELGDVIGCCSWAIIPTVHRGPIGRITYIAVTPAHRRRGIATRLLDAAETSLKKGGCGWLEAISDITINNSHNFFRSLEFEQTSYRFARAVLK